MAAIQEFGFEHVQHVPCLHDLTPLDSFYKEGICVLQNHGLSV